MNPVNEFLLTLFLGLGTVAFATYIIHAGSQMKATVVAGKAQEVADKYGALFNQYVDEMETKVELWWSLSGRPAVERRIAERGNPIAAAMGLPEEVKAGADEQYYEMVKHAATHVAAYRATYATFQLSCRKMRKVNVTFADQFEQQVEEHYREHRKELLDSEIDLDAFEQEFALS